MSKQPPFNISIDTLHSPSAAAELGTMRGSMVGAAEKKALPDRFLTVPHAHRPAVIIHDNETGRSTTVSLCDYHGARKLLGDLFGPPKPTAAERLEALGLPLIVERDGFKAIGGPSLFHDDDLCYRIEIDGVDGGEVGIARIELRAKDRVFVVTNQDGLVCPRTTLDGALDVVEDQVLPLYASGPRP
ncbi:hypothetical protein [Bosea sp. RAC05]|uniref:hypothetical protein n=1 Tax=Bosea sp. RAC05 TaxID=1842539 RepID=UPI00083D8090|nr:hypothetical protein [Bosea sp. RAC05]AOG02877.1 hypothetical protein BSY19_5163 [Bosea sp. RAC05]